MHTIALRLMAVTTVGAATLALSAVTASAATTTAGRCGGTGVSSRATPPEPAAAGLSTTAASARPSSVGSRLAPTGSSTGWEPGTARSGSAASVPVYVHVMAGSSGEGDVSDGQIADQIDVLNATYAGAESGQAANTGFSFFLAGTDRFYNDTWHRDGASRTYRSQTRQGGSDALNIWLVDFSYLGIATFPWDYSSDPAVDGIRVQYSSLPGGDATNYNLGETATHEAGHWLGLYHTFQGGCTSTNDEVSDTPAQAGPSSGCPVGADTCSLPGADPIHNYMDYSYDSCYNQFTQGQSSRMSQMWTAYRG